MVIVGVQICELIVSSNKCRYGGSLFVWCIAVSGPECGSGARGDAAAPPVSMCSAIAPALPTAPFIHGAINSNYRINNSTDSIFGSDICWPILTT